jgi:hypothetical protein
MKAHQLRKLAISDPEAFRRQIAGARKRDLAARHLLLHPEHVSTASQEALDALSEYMADQRWRSLYAHDRRMYRILKSGAELFQQLVRSHAKSQRLFRSKTACAQDRRTISPASASIIRKTLGIRKSEVPRILRTFIAAGVKV